jgi:hypothetical protein
MAITIKSIDQLKVHIEGVMQRADHHAQSVYKVVLTLVGLVAWKADKIDARTQEGRNANVIWFEVKGKRYAIVFNHENSCIDIRDRSQQGNNLMSIDNDTDVDKLIKFYENL